jgi:hypothetical protein
MRRDQNSLDDRLQRLYDGVVLERADRARLARDCSAGGGHQPFSVGRVDRGCAGRLDEIVISGCIGAGRSDDFGQHRDLGRIELDGPTLAC